MAYANIPRAPHLCLSNLGADWQKTRIIRTHVNDRSRSLKHEEFFVGGPRVAVAIPNDRSRSLKLALIEHGYSCPIQVAIPNDRSRSLKRLLSARHNA